MSHYPRNTAKMLALTGLLAGTLCVGAQAQQFAFGSATYDVVAGQNVQIPIVLSGVGEPVAGANFTVRISDADNGRLRLSDATGNKDGALAAFTYMDNTLSRASYVNGSVPFSGLVQEYRAVLYSPDSSPATFPASNPTTIAVLSIPTDAAASGAVTIELVSAIDSQTGLLGVSNATGQSLVPGGADRPAGSTAVVNINAASEFPVTTDFKATGGNDNWEYIPGLGGTTSANVVGAGLSAASTEDLSFGFWTSKLQPDGLTGWRVPTPGLLYVVDFEATSTAANNTQEPTIRTRVSSANDFLISEVLAQEIVGFGDNGVDVTALQAGTTYRVVSPVPAFIQDGGFDGFKLAFDLIQYGIGNVGTAIRLGAVTERVADPAALTGESVVYSATFDSGNTNGWLSSFDLDPVFGGNIGRRTVTFPVDASGIGVTSSGAFEFCNPGECSSIPQLNNRFSFGFWRTPTSLPTFTATSNKWYKVEVDFRVDAATDPKDAPWLRIRMFPDSEEFFQVVSINPFVDRGRDALPRPTPSGGPMTFWTTVHPGASGQRMNLAFDMIHTVDPQPGGNAAPTGYLKSITVTEYNAPF